MSVEQPGPVAESPPPRQSQGRRFLFAALVLSLLCALCSPFFMDLVARGAPKAQAGVVNFAQWGPLTAPVELSGVWKLTWRTPGPGQPRPDAAYAVAVPGRWSDRDPRHGTLPDQGAASYELQVRGLTPGRYILHVPGFFMASRVLVDGVALSEAGVAGPTAATTRPEVRSHDIPIDVAGSSLDVRIDLSAFQHRDNGMENPPLLGFARPMERWIALEWARSFLFISSLMLLFCYGLIIFLFRPRERAPLLFGLSVLFLIPIVAIFSHDNLLLLAFPATGFTGMLGIQYLSGVVGMICFLAYAHHLFPQESPSWLFRLVVSLHGALFVWMLIDSLRGDTLGASQVSQWSLPLRAATLLYMVGIVVAACFKRREGALVFLLGLGIFAGGLVYSDLVTNNLLREGWALDMRMAVLVLLFSHVIILAERWSLSISSAELSADELRRLLDVSTSITSEMQLEALLAKIVQAVSRIVHADRSSLFLHDEKTHELWSLVAEGVDTRELRFDSDLGLAGDALRSGRASNVAKAYEDPRFNSAIDALTGYRTESVLTLPVTTRDGRRLGVLQALNRQGAAAFGEEDVARMGAFAAQTAVAIDNATLFTEVASERSYNESIVSSMSNGVITLDRDAQAAKLNAAACRIMGLPPDQSAGVDAQTLLLGPNPWLAEPLAEVARTGLPKSLLDADLQIPSGARVAVNLSIVPWISEGQPVGLLVLIEDLSEGKRIQGALRRFMTQEVVDQVLGRDDGMLFGVACQASVLFADIRNFSGLSEALPPRETVDMLNEVFTDLFEAVAASGGVLDKYMGDAVMAVFGAPLSSGRDPLNAVESAIAMRRMLAALNLRRLQRGQPEINIGIGVATGEVVAGTIGSPKRMDYTVIGDSVNVASRLQATTKLYGVGVVICEATAAATGDALPLRELDTIRVRGRRQPSRIFQVITEDLPTPPDTLAAYARGRTALRKGDWAAAVTAFETAVASDPFDAPSALMLERALALRQAPPEAWDGAWPPSGAAEVRA